VVKAISQASVIVPLCHVSSLALFPGFRVRLLYGNTGPGLSAELVAVQFGFIVRNRR